MLQRLWGNRSGSPSWMRDKHLQELLQNHWSTEVVAKTEAEAEAEAEGGASEPEGRERETEERIEYRREG